MGKLQLMKRISGTQKTKLLFSFLAAAIVLSLPTIAKAQNRLKIEEVIVTAEKREQSLQDVPISISAFNKTELDKRGIDEVEDIAANVPNLVINSFNNDASTVRLFIRGIGQNDVQLTQDPSVAMYVDGIYVGTSIGSGLEMADLERIEVLRGPQGTLYGRNATGGAVNLITKKPDLDTFSINQVITAGNFDQFKSKTTINQPLSDTSAAKLAIYKSRRDGFVENTGVGPDWGLEDREGFRVDYTSQLTDNLTLDLSYDKTNVGDSGRFEQIRGNISPFVSQAVTSTVPFQDARIDEAASFRNLGESKVKVDGTTMSLSWDVNDLLTIKSITGIRNVSSDIEHDGTPHIGVTFTQAGPKSVSYTRRSTDFEQFSTELQFIGSNGSSTIDYVAGIYFYDDKAEQSVPFSESVLGDRAQDFTSSENESLAFYGQVTFSPESFDDRLHFTIGGRHSEDKRRAFRINESSVTFAELGGYQTADCAFAYFYTEDLDNNPATPPTHQDPTACTPNPNGSVEGAKYKKKFMNFKPSFTVAYDVNDNANVYAKYVQGYKSGGTSQRSANPNNFRSGFNIEEVDSKEIGFKTQLLNSRLQLNGALFDMSMDGYQASVQTGYSAGDRDFIPLDGTSIKGAELDLIALLTEKITLTLAYGYLDAENGVDQVSTQTSSGATQITEVVKAVSYAPEHSASIALDYQTQTSLGQLDARLGLSYQDEAATSLNLADNIPTDSRQLLDLNITLSGIEIEDATLALTLWGKNLTDKEYYLINGGSLGGSLGLTPWTTFGDPRTFGFTVKASF